MLIQTILSKKIKGDALSYEELKFFIEGVTDHSISDYQISALLTAMFIHGLNSEELKNLTYFMANSGETLDLSQFPSVVDKHSSGGVGDKVTLIVTPLIASFGIKVAKMSGRGLSHTGGTIDKLESIPNFNVNLTQDQFISILDQVGCAVISQTGNMCYADKKLYGLRDLTGTVDSIPLIASSIMSKKIAAGAPNIILDVKCGSGAFMKTVDDAKELSHMMVELGKNLGRNMVALVTNMNEPLGYNIGNSLEVMEAVDILKGKYVKGLSELCEVISAQSLLMCNKAENYKEALKKVKEHLKNKKALYKFKEMILAQEGEAKFIEDYSLLPLSKAYEIYSKNSGYICKTNSADIGLCSMLLGGGRKKIEDQIDYGAGIILNKKLGDFVCENELLATFYTNQVTNLEEAKMIFENSFEFSNKIPTLKSIIIDKIT